MRYFIFAILVGLILVQSGSAYSNGDYVDIVCNFDDLGDVHFCGNVTENDANGVTIVLDGIELRDRWYRPGSSECYFYIVQRYTYRAETTFPMQSIVSVSKIQKPFINGEQKESPTIGTFGCVLVLALVGLFYRKI